MDPNIKLDESLQDEVGDPVAESYSHVVSACDGDHSHEFLTPSDREDIQDFVNQYGLLDQLSLFKKAALLLIEEVNPARVPDISKYELAALHNESHKKWRQPKPMYLTIVVTALGAIGQGWAQTGMNGANLYFPQAFGIDSKTSRNALILGLINCGIYLSNGLLGSWLVAPLNDRLGRRGAVFSAAAVSLVSNLGCAITQNWQQLLLFRLVLGCALAIISSTLCVYAAESAPASIRGGLAVSWQMFCAFGFFLGFVFNLAVEDLGSFKWRLQLGAPAISTLPLLALIYVCPESPSWYMKHAGQYRSAYESLQRLRNTDLQAAKELYASYLQFKRSTEAAAKSSYFKSIRELFTIARIRRATVASYAVMISQQLSGINIIAFYSSTIFVEADFSQSAALVASTVFGFVNFVGAFPAIWTMDTLGRRALLLITLPLMALTMSIAAGSFSIPDTSSTLKLSVLVTMIYLFCALYSPGMGPVPAAYSAEVFPLSHREMGSSSAIAMTNLFASVLSLTFPWLLNNLGSQGAFFLYAALNLLAFVLVFLLVPETKARSLEELDSVFQIRTRDFIGYQFSEYVPWWIDRYVLRRKNAVLKPFEQYGSGVYKVLGQDEDE